MIFLINGRGSPYRALPRTNPMIISIEKVWKLSTPTLTFDLEVQTGVGVHDLQIFRTDFSSYFFEEVPGKYQVASL